MPSPRLLTAQKYIAHFATLDTALLASLLADSYHHEFAPASLNPPGPFNKTSFIAHIQDLANVMAGFPVNTKAYFECEAQNSVIVWASSEAQFREEVMGLDKREQWAYQGEYVFMLTLDEGGGRVVRTVEFLDSLATREGLFPLVKRARGDLGSSGGNSS